MDIFYGFLLLTVQRTSSLTIVLFDSSQRPKRVVKFKIWTVFVLFSYDPFKYLLLKINRNQKFSAVLLRFDFNCLFCAKPLVGKVMMDGLLLQTK